MNAVEDNSVLTKETAGGRKNCSLSDWAAALLALIFLSVLTVVCYYRSLKGYFLADDMVHVAFLKQVFDGHAELLAQNFWTNWLQAQGTQFYRPVISLTLAFDYLVWGANAFGFHLSNLLLEIASTFFLYLTCTRLFPSLPQRKMQWTALGAAALFAVSPLHAEVVSWIIARVDSVVTTFYLLTFWLYLKAQQSQRNRRLYSIFSVLSFVIALMSKEMAVALPAVLTLCHLLGGASRTEQPKSLAGKFKAALINTCPYWLVLIAYFGVRVVALGTLVGGYQGSIGAGLTGSVAKRLTDGTFARLFFPFNALVFVGGNKVAGWLKLLYVLVALSGVWALWRALRKRQTGLVALLSFAFGWFVLALLPALQVLALTDALQGSRLVYLATAPMALFLATMVLPPEDDDGVNVSSKARSQAGFTQIRIVVLLALIGCFANVSIKNNLPWVHASRELKALRGALQEELKRLPEKRIIALFNLPQTYKGAHIVYNAATFSVVLRPPLSPTNLSSRVATFEPVTYGYDDLISATRLKNLLQKPEYACYRWDRDSLALVPLNMERLGSEAETLELGPADFSLTGDQSLVSPVFRRSPLNSDFLNVDLMVTTSDGIDEFQPASVLVSWCTDSNSAFTAARTLALPIKADNARHQYHLNLSEHKIWLESDPATRLKFDIYPRPCKAKLYSVSLSSGSTSIPVLNALCDLDGICQTNPMFAFSYDVSAIPGAVKAMYEISKPNSWFEHYSSGTYRDSAPSKERLTSETLGKVKDRGIVIDEKALAGAGFYELRVAALDKDGKMIGYFSDPINFQHSPGSVAK